MMQGEHTTLLSALLISELHQAFYVAGKLQVCGQIPTCRT